MVFFLLPLTIQTFFKCISFSYLFYFQYSFCHFNFYNVAIFASLTTCSLTFFPSSFMIYFLFFHYLPRMQIFFFCHTIVFIVQQWFCCIIQFDSFCDTILFAIEFLFYTVQFAIQLCLPFNSFIPTFLMQNSCFIPFFVIPSLSLHSAIWFFLFFNIFFISLIYICNTCSVLLAFAMLFFWIQLLFIKIF